MRMSNDNKEKRPEKEKRYAVKTKKESALRKRFRNDEVTDEERAQDWFNKR